MQADRQNELQTNNARTARLTLSFCCLSSFVSSCIMLTNYAVDRQVKIRQGNKPEEIVELGLSTTIQEFYRIVAARFNLPLKSFGLSLNGKDCFDYETNHECSVSELGIKNGDVVYVINSIVMQNPLLEPYGPNPGTPQNDPSNPPPKQPVFPVIGGPEDLFPNFQPPGHPPPGIAPHIRPRLPDPFPPKGPWPPPPNPKGPQFPGRGRYL